MPNDSSTGGYLQPSLKAGFGTQPDLEDVELDRFLQGIVVGIVGMEKTLVRPRWQPEPPTIPDVDKDWCAIGVMSVASDWNAYTHYENLTWTVKRSQILEVQATFYGPNCKALANLLGMGFQVPQNREVMLAQSYGLVETGTASPVVPELINSRWVRRVDLPFSLRRAQEYTYSVLDLRGAKVLVNNEVMPILEVDVIAP